MKSCSDPKNLLTKTLAVQSVRCFNEQVPLAPLKRVPLKLAGYLPGFPGCYKIFGLQAVIIIEIGHLWLLSIRLDRKSMVVAFLAFLATAPGIFFVKIQS